MEPRSAGSYRDLAGSSSRLSPRPHPFFAPFHLLVPTIPRRAHFFLSSSPSLVLLSSFVLVLHPGLPPAPRSWPFSFSLPPLFSHALLARARARARACYAPHQWQDRVLVLRRPAFLRIAHACHDIPSRELEERKRRRKRRK